MGIIEEENLRYHVARVRFAARHATASFRRVPNVLIIGAQRSGTTTLYHRLSSIPYICGAFTKEVHYFDYNSGRGVDWYRAHFATRVKAKMLEHLYDSPSIHVEASPTYLIHPKVPERVVEQIGFTRVIASLRNPVERAYSHYQHERRQGREERSFGTCVQDELENMKSGGVYGTEEDWDAPEGDIRRKSYLRRGVYIDQIRNWSAALGRERVFAFQAERLFHDDRALWRELSEYLGVSITPTSTRAYYSHSYPELTPDIRERLVTFYEPFNRELESWMGVELGW
jgi:hypothetical protein